MAGLEDDARRQYARERLSVQITPVAGARPGFAVAGLCNALVDLKRQVTDRCHSNALYRARPAVAILDVRDGTAQAKVDVRTDDRLFSDMARIAGPIVCPARPSCAGATQAWSSPASRKTANFRRFFNCCRRAYPSTVTAAHSGWNRRRRFFPKDWTCPSSSPAPAAPSGRTKKRSGLPSPT